MLNQNHERAKWHNVPTDQNPADIGSRGVNITTNQLSTWSSLVERQSNVTTRNNLTLRSSPEATEELKCLCRVQALATSSPNRDEFDKPLVFYRVRKALRIGPWMRRFIRNCRSRSDDRKYGLLKTGEVEQEIIWWIKQVQREAIDNVKLVLNLQANDADVLKCKGRIGGASYIPAGE